MMVRLALCLFTASLLTVVFNWSGKLRASEAPVAAAEVVRVLEQTSWQTRQDGFSSLRVITQNGQVITAYRISPANFDIEVVLQRDDSGSRVRTIGEATGAMLTVNGGFFAQTGQGTLYPVGYLRKDGEVLSKGWPSAGGLVEFTASGLKLTPSHEGIPQTGKDLLQTRPMILEPGGKWSMNSNAGPAKQRTLLCQKKNGEIILVIISRLGLRLYEAGWLLRDKGDGGYFGCDAAVALDGGRSTQIWDADDPSFSHAGLSAVHNFLIVRPKQSE